MVYDTYNEVVLMGFINHLITGVITYKCYCKGYNV